MKVSELKRGMIVEIDGELWNIISMDHTMPGKGRAYYQTQLKSLKRGRVIQRRLSGADDIKLAFVEAKSLEYLYKEGEDYVFMDKETYDQLILRGELVKESMQYVRHNATVKAQFYENEPIGLDLPASVVLKVNETEPSARGDTVKNVTKPAVLETGLVVKVPAHVVSNDYIKVDTRTGEFLSRASAHEIPTEE